MSEPVKVLLVEDSEDDAMLALHALRRGGFEPAFRRVQTAAELETALAGEQWDAVIADYRMPGFTGVDALRIFRSTDLDIPFILISGTIGEETAVAAMKAGASDYVMKQSLARLAPALERELKDAKIRAAHRQSQCDLMLSEQRLRAIIETGPECIKVVSQAGMLLDMNAAGLAMLEADSLAAVQSQPLLHFIVPECRAAFGALHERVLRGESGMLEFEVVGLKGGRRWLEIHAAPLRDATSDVTTLLGVTRDITERKEAAQELRKSESRFRSLTGLSSDWYWEQDASFRFTVMSGGVLNKGNFAVNKALGKTRWELPIELGESEWAAHRATLEAHRPFTDFEYRIVTDDRSMRYYSVRGEPVFDDQGRFTGYRGTANDITRRKEAEAGIKRLNRVYAVLSGINALLMRVRERDELFNEACRIVVDAGGFRMALISMVDAGASKIVPVASAGKDEALLAAIKAVLSSREDAPNTMVARALREKRAVVANDSQNDPRVKFHAKYAASGVRSMAVLPLIVAEEAVGVFALYTSEIAFFQAEELNLLEQLAGNIAFAIDHLDKQTRLDYLAYYDVLTGLANRSLFLERVAQHMRGAADGGHQLAVFLIDLERFKNINDSLGQAAGDALLRQVAARLTRGAGDASLVARLGADLFGAVLPLVKQNGSVVRLLEKTMAAFTEHPFRLDSAVLRVAARVGVALFPEDGNDAGTLFRNAEAALKLAKASGERYLFHTQTMTAAVAGKLTLENQLRQALDNDEFVLHYHPKVNFASGKVTGAEALIRWNDPRTGLVPPGRFIPMLEETGMIHDVGRWALRQAVADYLRWRAAGLAAVRIAVNVSPLQLRHRGFVDEIRQVIGGDAQAAAGLELEITENLIMADVKGSIASLQAIRDLGVSIAIDDFGTGFSSLSYLAKLPVDTLKVDQSFVHEMSAGLEGLALVSTIINLAHALNLKAVAEGVETEEQSRLLRLLHCDEMQGFLFSKPVPAAIFETRFLAPAPAGDE